MGGGGVRDLGGVDGGGTWGASDGPHDDACTPVPKPPKSAKPSQLQKRKADLAVAARKVMASRFQSAAAFAKAHAHVIKDYKFSPGDLVLYRNTKVEKEASRKHKPRYLGPMRVVTTYTLSP